jgi:hypothetical protein
MRIEEQYQVEGLFDNFRAAGAISLRTQRQVRFQLTVERNPEAIAVAEFRAGWRIYATNAPAERLPLDRAVTGTNTSKRTSSAVCKDPSITPVCSVTTMPKACFIC